MPILRLSTGADCDGYFAGPAAIAHPSDGVGGGLRGPICRNNPLLPTPFYVKSSTIRASRPGGRCDLHGGIAGRRCRREPTSATRLDQA